MGLSTIEETLTKKRLAKLTSENCHVCGVTLTWDEDFVSRDFDGNRYCLICTLNKQAGTNENRN